MPPTRDERTQQGRDRAGATRTQLLGVLGPEPVTRQLRVVIALERAAAKRYVRWSEAASGDEQAGLLACARREEEVARLIEEAAFSSTPADTADTELIARAVALFETMYTGLAREEQMAAQAPSELYGAELWRTLRGADPDGPLAAAYEQAEKLEQESAHYLEGLLARLP